MPVTIIARIAFQGSVLLNEGRCVKYVTALFIMYLVFKSPHVVVDILTQLNVTVAYEPRLAPNATAEAALVAEPRFYYQTGLSWMMFSFSSIFPIITFMYFHDHWRRLKKFITCGTATVSIANSGKLHLCRKSEFF